MENLKNLSPDQLDAIKDILGDKVDTQYITIELPSNGAAYSKEVQLRPFNFEDEKFALSNKVKKSDFINVLLDRCLKDVSVDSLLLCDKNYLITKLKEISTGSDVSMLVLCGSCGVESNVMVDLTLLKVNSFEDEEIPIKFKLDSLDKEAVVRPARVQDEKNISTFETFSNNLWRFVESIHGVEDKAVLSEVLPKLPVQDVHKIMKFVNMSDYGIVDEFNYVCDACGNQQVVEVPLTANFFGDS
jgi:hypothetical protein